MNCAHKFNLVAPELKIYRTKLAIAMGVLQILLGLVSICLNVSYSNFFLDIQVLAK